MPATGEGSEQAEAASPISSRPPASINFDDLADDDRIGGGGGISSGIRWPRQETVALLKIRSEMDLAFRDANLKGPIWDEVSRKLGELGYIRSAKKCKEKFENVHKYYKRTKEGRAGKSYRFFSQLEALQGAATASGSGSVGANSPPPSNDTPVMNSRPPTTAAAPVENIQFAPVSQTFNIYWRDLSMAAAPGVGIRFSSDSSFDSDEEEEERPLCSLVESGQKRKRGQSSKGGGKRRMRDFIKGLMKQVMQKQEAMLQRFLEIVEKREQDRMMRTEAWKRQETARLSREQGLAAQERAMAASRDAAILSFLQKITGQTIQLPQPVSTTFVAPPAAPTSVPASAPPPSRQLVQQQLPNSQQSTETPSAEVIRAVPERQIPPQEPPSAGGISEQASSRWPKAEVLALIKLRSNLEIRYQDAGPKGPLWEEISASMRRMGYNRSSKRCKEKWENINKYFKKVKESNKKRPEDAKTCPYFNELDALYQRKIGSSSSPALFQQQALALNQSKHQETPVHYNPGTVQDGSTHVESLTKRDDTHPEQQNALVLPTNTFGDQGANAPVPGKPADMMMEQEEQQQLNLDELAGDDSTDTWKDEDESKEERKLSYKIEFQRPPTNTKNGGNNGAPSFITMVQ